MSYTDPFTFTAGLIPTAAQLNAALRDNIRASGGPRSTTPPTATDEQEWIYPVDPTNGFLWRFKYAIGSVSTYKWESCGSDFVVVTIATDETATTGAYVDLATPGPSFTVPRAGDYEWEVEADMYHTVAATQMMASPKNGAAATSDANAAKGFVYNSGSGGALSWRKTGVFLGMAASDVIKVQYKGNAATAHFLNRVLKVRPIRVS